jgi:HSP20 family protein
MQVTKYSPMWSVRDMRYPNRFGRLYEQMLESVVGQHEARSLMGHETPLVDVIEEPQRIRLVAELPGMKPEDVSISLEDNVLTLQGEKKEEERREENTYRPERAYGVFERSFRLPATIDAGNIVARFESGLLTILLPKVEAAQPRQITINIE